MAKKPPPLVLDPALASWPPLGTPPVISNCRATLSGVTSHGENARLSGLTTAECDRCGEYVASSNGEVPRHHRGSLACETDFMARSFFKRGLVPYPATGSLAPAFMERHALSHKAAGIERANTHTPYHWPTRASLGLRYVGEINRSTTLPPSTWQVWMPFWVRVVTELWSAPESQPELHTAEVLPGGVVVDGVGGKDERRNAMLRGVEEQPDLPAAIAAAWRLGGNRAVIGLLDRYRLLGGVRVPRDLWPKD